MGVVGLFKATDAFPWPFSARLLRLNEAKATRGARHEWPWMLPVVALIFVKLGARILDLGYAQPVDPLNITSRHPSDKLLGRLPKCAVGIHSKVRMTPFCTASAKNRLG
ncbi:hypothetical protein D3C87_1279150 [compost metagenome]